MKLAVVGVAAFVIGVAGGTMLSPARRAAPVDSTPAAPVEHKGGGDAVSMVVSEPVAQVAPAAPSSAAEVSAIGAAIAKLPAAEAGPMLARLSDADAVAVLKSVPLARASDILDTMPPEQAARLSKQLLLSGVAP